jgi:hypothetical protein
MRPRPRAARFIASFVVLRLCARPMTAPARPTPPDENKPSNFLRQVIERDLAQGTYAGRTFAGTPGDAAHHATSPLDPARIRTRFPPEPNGYLHIGHAKSICLNFGLARDYGGVCHLRFDDTNPEKEEQEYVDAILEAVRWLGFGWEPRDARPAGRHAHHPAQHLYYASNYFDFMYRAAEALIGRGLAYVDEQTPEQMRANRGDFNTPGTDSPFRSRTPAENLARFREMRDGKLADGAAVLRAKIDMASPNINLRDPALYRIKHATHHNTGDKWCIYPMYTYAHPIEDALETHHPQHLHAGVRRPAPLLRLAARQPGCTPGPAGAARCPTSTSSAAEPHLRDHQQAQAQGSWSTKAMCQWLGRPAHAHHLRHAPPRLHTGEHPR